MCNLSGISFFEIFKFLDFKGLAAITVSDRILRDKAFNNAKNPKYDGYERGLASIVCKFFDKETSGSGSTKWEYLKSRIRSNFI